MFSYMHWEDIKRFLPGFKRARIPVIKKYSQSREEMNRACPNEVTMGVENRGQILDALGVCTREISSTQ